jgi:glutamyl-tRNA synthetase
VKKGVLMKSLRAALLGSLQGPDLISSWRLLHALGEDRSRLPSARAQSARAQSEMP